MKLSRNWNRPSVSKPAFSWDGLLAALHARTRPGRQPVAGVKERNGLKEGPGTRQLKGTALLELDRDALRTRCDFTHHSAVCMKNSLAWMGKDSLVGMGSLEAVQKSQSF